MYYLVFLPYVIADNLHLINVVRLHLRVLFISDMLTPQKSIIKKCYLLGLRSPYAVTHLVWPYSAP